MVIGFLAFFAFPNGASAAQLWNGPYGSGQFVCGAHTTGGKQWYQNMVLDYCNFSAEASASGIYLTGAQYSRDSDQKSVTVECNNGDIIVGLSKWGDNAQLDSAWCRPLNLGGGATWSYTTNVPVWTTCPQNSVATGFKHVIDKNDAWGELVCRYIYVPAFTIIGGAPTGNDNIPPSFNPGETKSTNNVYQGIQMVNNRQVPWISDWVGWAGIPSVGLCNSKLSIMEGGAPGNPDPPASSDGSSCTTRYVWASNQVYLQHSGSFTTPVNATYLKWGTITTSGNYGLVDNGWDHEHCDYSGDEPDCWDHYHSQWDWEWSWWMTTSYDVGSSQHIVPGESVWFPVGSMTAPATPGTYTEWWNFVYAGGGGYTQQFTNFSKNITVSAPNGGPVVTNATINANPVNPDGSTTYTVTVTGTDPQGGGDIDSMYAVINHQGTNAGQYRGYLGWSSAASFPAASPLSSTAAESGGSGSCTGGGQRRSFANSGNQYITLISCTTSVSPANTRTVNFVVTFDPSFVSPITDNRISGWARDLFNAEFNWAPFGTFNLPAPGTVTVNSVYEAVGSVGDLYPQVSNRPHSYQVTQNGEKNGPVYCPNGTVMSGLRTWTNTTNSTAKASIPLCSAWTSEAVAAGLAVSQTGTNRIDYPSNGGPNGTNIGAMYCPSGMVVNGAEWAKDNQLDYGYCRTLTSSQGQVRLGPAVLVTATAVSTYYYCPQDSLLVGGKNAPGKNDSWNAFYCAKVTVERNSPGGIQPLSGSWILMGPVATAPVTCRPTQVYSSVPGGAMYGPTPTSACVQNYALNSIRTEHTSLASAPTESGWGSMLGLFEPLYTPVARAVTVEPPPPQYLLPGGNLTFNIIWDPVATLAVSTTPSAPCVSPNLCFSTPQGSANPTGVVTVSNNGAVGSTLSWTGTVGGSNSSRVRLNSQAFGANETGSLFIPGGSTSASQNVGVTVDINGLAAGTYNNFATITFSGISQPGGITAATTPPAGGFPGLADKTVNISLTVSGFTIDVTPPSLARPQGAPINFTVDPNCGGGYAGTINNFQTQNLHNNASKTFSPTSLNNCSGTSNLSIVTDSTTELGMRTVIVSADGSGLTPPTRTDTVDLTIESLSPTGNPFTADNTTQCEEITLKWNEVTDESEYIIYRADGSGPRPVFPGPGWTRIGDNSPNDKVYVEPDDNDSGVPAPVRRSFYHYAVTARYGAVESSPAFAGPVEFTACQPRPSGGIRVSRVTDPNGNFADYGVGEIPRIKNGDTLTFTMTVGNTGTADGLDVRVDNDTTNNLTYIPNPGFRQTSSGDGINRNGCGGGVCSSEPVGGEIRPNVNYVVTWDSDADLGDKPNNGSNWVLTFRATVNSQSIQPVDFIEDIARITMYYAGEEFPATVRTGLLPVQIGQRIPSIIEVAP